MPRQDDPDTWQRGAAPRHPRHLQPRARHAHIRAQVRPSVTIHDTVTCHDIVTCDVLQPRQRLPASPHHPELHDEGGLGHGRGALRVLPREGVAGEPRLLIYHVTFILSRVRPATPSPISLRRPASPRAGRCWPGSSGGHNKYNEHYQYQVSQVCDIGASPRGLAAGRDHRGHHHLLRRDEEQGAEGLREARAAAAAQQQGGVIVSNQD